MTTDLDKKSAAGLTAALGGIVYQDGWPDALHEPDDGRLMAVEWKRDGDAWRTNQAAIAALFHRLGIPYCIARSEGQVIARRDAILDFPGVYSPLELLGKVWMQQNGGSA